MYPTTSENIDNVSIENEEEKAVETQGSIQNRAEIVPPTMGHKISDTNCCSFIKEGVQKFWLLDWYIAPITYDIGFTLSCLIYHYVNFAFALGMGILLITGIGTFVPFIILACVGLPLLYFLAEVTIILTRFNHLYNYYLVEKDLKLLTTEKWRAKLTLDNKKLPLCGTFCISGSRLNRIKFIFTSKDFYLMIVYHLFVNSFTSIFLGICSIPELGLLYYITYILRYPFQPQWFKNNRECAFGGGSCDNLPCKCSGWAINNFGNVFGIFIISLILLPFTCHLCNYAAKLSKSLNYYFLTDYYKYKGDNTYNPNQTLISTNNNSTGTNTNKIEINDTVEINNQTVPRTNEDINDVGIDDVQL